MQQLKLSFSKGLKRDNKRAPTDIDDIEKSSPSIFDRQSSVSHLTKHD